jgi:tetraacyldisaccharide 4'-kinase
MSILESKFIEKTVLSPLSSLWENIYRARRSFYEYGLLKKDYFKVPIISVGNVTFGGTGKTPMIIYLTRKMEEHGLTPAVLTRGYKGELEHKSGLIKGGQRFRSNPKKFGDEPLLISRKMNTGAVIVGKRRADNLKKYFHEVEPDVVLLDDGFQHIQLYRSFNIVLFDSALELERYKTAPLGYLREGLTALKDADAIVLSRADQVSEDKIESLLEMLSKYHRRGIPIARFSYKPDGIFDCFDKKSMDVEDLEGQNVIALSAIASPDSFYQLLEGYGANIVDKIVYPDHYLFTQSDMNEILIKCSNQSAIVVTSEKDMVKIRRVVQDSRIVYVNISVSFISGEEDFLKGIKKVLDLDYD